MPIHREVGGDFGEARSKTIWEPLEAAVLQGGEDDAHKELPGERVIELRGFFDIALVVGQAGRDCGHDAGFVTAF